MSRQPGTRRREARTRKASPASVRSRSLQFRAAQSDPAEASRLSAVHADSVDNLPWAACDLVVPLVGVGTRLFEERLFRGPAVPSRWVGGERRVRPLPHVIRHRTGFAGLCVDVNALEDGRRHQRLRLVVAHFVDEADAAASNLDRSRANAQNVTRVQLASIREALIDRHGNSVERGFKSDGVIVVNVRSTQPYDAARGFAVQQAMLERLRSLPGIQSASAGAVLPIGRGLWTRGVQIEGYTFRADESDSVGFNVIAPGYFATLGTPVVVGREFDDRDTATSPKVAVVNESFARYFFGNATALGRHVTSVGVTYEMVGVVRDAKYQNLREPILKTMYIPWLQRVGDQPTRYGYLARVGQGDPMRVMPGLERLVREVDPSLRVRTTLTYGTLVDRSIATERIMATLGSFFGVLALMIAAIGLFGILAFQVSRRTNELGVRMALGATRQSMIALILREVAGMVVPGILVGIGAALALSGLARVSCSD